MSFRQALASFGVNSTWAKAEAKSLPVQTFSLLARLNRLRFAFILRFRFGSGPDFSYTARNTDRSGAPVCNRLCAFVPQKPVANRRSVPSSVNISGLGLFRSPFHNL